MSKNITLLQEQFLIEDHIPIEAVVFVTFKKGKFNFLSFTDNSIRIFLDENTIDPRLVVGEKVVVIETVEEFREKAVNLVDGKFFCRYYVAKAIFPKRF